VIGDDESPVTKAAGPASPAMWPVWRAMAPANSDSSAQRPHDARAGGSKMKR
jgi:hypothetical protein